MPPDVDGPPTEWRPIPGFATCEASDDGRIRRAGVEVPTWRHEGPVPYRYVTLGPVKVAVHRLVLLAFVGPCPAGMQCRHHPDPDPTNNRPTNLRWGTPLQNAADKSRHRLRKLEAAGQLELLR